MKTLRIVILSLCVALLLTACGGNTPETVLKKYVDAAKTADFGAAKTCLIKSLAQEFDEMAKGMTEDDINELKEKNKDLEVKIIRSEINGDNAVVYFEEVGDNQPRDERHIPFVKEDGEWKMAVID